MRFSRPFKHLMKTEWFHHFVSWCIAKYIYLVYKTSRWELHGLDIRDRLINSEEPFIIILWHNRIAMMPFAWPTFDVPLCILASGHRDGMMVDRAMGRYGVETIPVSSRSTGAGSVKAIVKELRNGGRVGITPDGPRGPRMRCKDGVVAMARLAKVRVAMVAYATSRRKLLRSWDKFCFPLPFSRGVVLWHEGYELPDKPDAEALEAFRVKLEDGLTALTDEADRMVGNQPISPAGPEEAAR